MPPKSKKSKVDTPIASTSKSAPVTSQQKVPSWPQLSPLLSSADLELINLLPSQVLTIPHFWTANLCKTYVNFLSSLPLTTTPGKPKKGDAVRVNDRFQVEDAAFAERLYSETALKSLVTSPVIDGKTLTASETRELFGGEVLGLNSNIRIYRYQPGQFFDQHYDDSNNIAFPSAAAALPTPAKTTWTLLLYLTAPSTGCKGGETVFYPDAPSKREAAPPPVVAELEVGLALLHRHGKDCLLHEGREVTAGEKWVVRSDLCVKR
ncbi:hypothetical protein MBLNU230_g3981t1 [Neophaeotheca triangularis]